MKTYKETSDEVFEKIQTYKRRKRRVRHIAGVAAVLALVVILPAAILFSPMRGKADGNWAGNGDAVEEMPNLSPSDADSWEGTDSPDGDCESPE